MTAKTSQLQIRVSPEEKAALKRLAGTAGMTVSRYVISQVLPSAQRELQRLMEALVEGGADQGAHLAALATLISETSADDFEERLADMPLQGLPPVLQNQIAAIVEQAAHVKAAVPPQWVDEVRPLERPHFGWPLVSLRPHQIRVTPVAFKRRGIFFDPASRRAVPGAAGAAGRTPSGAEREALRGLADLNDHLASRELKVEFYLVGGAVLSQAFQARPPTAHVSALFGPAAAVSEAVRAVGAGDGRPSDWLTVTVKEHLAGALRRDRFVELPSLCAFVPSLDYLLAVKIAALRMGADARLDDLRYALRARNVSGPDEALAIAGRYFSERQLAPESRATLERLFAA